MRLLTIPLSGIYTSATIHIRSSHVGLLWAGPLLIGTVSPTESRLHRAATAAALASLDRRPLDNALVAHSCALVLHNPVRRRMKVNVDLLWVADAARRRSRHGRAGTSLLLLSLLRLTLLLLLLLLLLDALALRIPSASDTTA